MRRMLTFLAAGSGLLLTGIVAWADPQYGRPRGGWQRFSGSPVDSVMRDLERVHARSRVDGHERDHFFKARQELYRFEERWRDGRFDSGRLERAMDNIEHLVRSDQIHPRDRQILAQDLRMLRQLRAGRGFFGRGESYRY